MNLVGIIAEYNPFHNGHKLHIDKTVAQLSPDATVVIMSGNFTQRGSVSCFDKWTRAKMALLNGADLVIELPVTFATASAERFAYGGVYLLDKLGVKSISFGSEDNLEDLKSIASELLSDNFEINYDSSVPFHIARKNSLNNKELLAKPNNILAIEYLKAINILNSPMVAHRIERTGAGYHDMEIVDNTASATKVRELIKNSENYDDVIPGNLKDVYHSSKFVSEDNIYSQLQYSIISKSPKELEKYAHIREGIENRIYKSAFSSNSFDELVKNIKSKRYTYTSVSRMLISILLEIAKDDLFKSPQYVRVLGLNNRGAKALKHIEKCCELPVITKVSNAHNILSENALKEFEFDLKASDIYAAISGISTKGRTDFLTSPIKI